MFLKSTYSASTKPYSENITIYDVAILIAQLGDRPYLKISSPEHLTSGKIQLVAYCIQGAHMIRTGRSLFKDDFFVVDNRIENPKITKLFGPYDKRVTPFNMTESIKALLASPNSGISPESNILCQQTAYELVPKDYDKMMKFFRETPPYTSALTDPFKRIDKKIMKQYFESQLVSTTVFDSNIKIGV